ncbi:hypothetical protein M9H77_24580 [Catharanthus roseus]|uniref:Uncharacterized protein n=1 Tax=Catharanthus roseus TaxID=4058 RepID=A0ACC0AXR8_CATRO|nr:hypothetical protein M9H77_24580 [Catharanthus roseus]
MGRAPCCDKANVKKGPWSPEEDAKLKDYIEKHGTGGNWIALPLKAGLKRCGKSCRLRWLNYLRPNIKHGDFSDDEDRIICTLFSTIGSRWSIIAAQLPGRTDNDIKNYWNTKLKKKLMGMSQKRSQNSITPNSILLDHQSLSLTSSSSSLPYPTLSFTGYQNYSIPSTNNPPSVVIQGQEGNYMMNSSIHHYQDHNSFLRFGSEVAAAAAASSSSSDDGSSIFINRFEDDQQKPIINYDQNPSLDCSLEEIKQLISTNLTFNNNFFLDEIKIEEDKFTYY